MNVLVDSSVWIAFFRGTSDIPPLDWLIEEGLTVTNDIILAELTSALAQRRKNERGRSGWRLATRNWTCVEPPSSTLAGRIGSVRHWRRPAWWCLFMRL
jgi:predicted nucleic acid-binding protein